ncbi:hypothetical protein [Arthrobacter sp. NPDC090010]|uniref:hypothetical protein n=1 Tax=Arthrobacter sp. NPDC090010 TaxID=3363942 RepID=UPI0038284F76
MKQPRGGYINPRSLDTEVLSNHAVLNSTENVHASITGMAVDYLTRLASGASPMEAFETSLRGAYLLEQAAIPALSDAKEALGELKPGILPSVAAVVAACRLVRYNVVFRTGPGMYNPYAQPEPDPATIENIQTMVARAAAFFAQYGPIMLDGFTFDGAYTEIVTAGDGDFLTSDTLWDCKVSVKGPTKDHTLQVLMYYLMGMKSGRAEFQWITHLGVFNPGLNTVYRIKVAGIPDDVITEVSRDVIGYN